MINEIKKIVMNYLDNAKLCRMTTGTVVSGGIKVSDKLTIPDELVTGNLKKQVYSGDQVRLLRNHGGQEFHIAEIIDKKYILVGDYVGSGISISGKTVPMNEIVGNAKPYLKSGDSVRLIRDYGNETFYILEVIS